MKHFMVFALLMLSVGQLNASDIECETKENDNYFYGTWKGCNMRFVSAIDSPDVTISPRDESIEGLSLYYNKKIHFLPLKVAETFPNLLGYYAFGCSLTEISKSNFENLSKLRMLSLTSNQIEKIASNTFEDLLSLEYVELHANKIKAINGEVFQKLKKLTTVLLQLNVCINEDFRDQTRLTAMPQIVTKNCGFIETQMQQIVMNKTIMELENCQSENTKLNAELVAANNLKDRSDMAGKDLGEMTNIKDAMDTVQLKMSEIENLKAELQTKNVEINAKNIKIKNLEERVKILEDQSQW